MKFNKIFLVVPLLLLFVSSFCQSPSTEIIKHNKETIDHKKFAVFTPWLTFSNFGKPETNTHHYEILARYQITAKDAIGIKAATWKLFAPMGIPLGDSQFLDRSTFYPGRLKESGVGGNLST